MMDSGCLTTHDAFQGALLIHSPTAGTSLDHGTSTTGIVFGNGASSPGGTGTGMLPNADQGIFFSYSHLASEGGNISRYTVTSQLVDPAGPYRAVFQATVGEGTIQTDTPAELPRWMTFCS